MKRRWMAISAGVLAVVVGGGYALAQTTGSPWDQARLIERNCAEFLGPETQLANPDLQGCYELLDAPPINPNAPIPAEQRLLYCETLPDAASHPFCNPPTPPPSAPPDLIQSIEKYYQLKK
jgi:hypothetical protein